LLLLLLLAAPNLRNSFSEMTLTDPAKSKRVRVVCWFYIRPQRM